MSAMNTWAAQEQIATIDTWTLGERLRWPILRALSRGFVEKMELRRYTHDLLASGQWSVVRVAPHVESAGIPSTHVFDVFGVRYIP
jgi:hypothetical protein